MSYGSHWSVSVLHVSDVTSFCHQDNTGVMIISKLGTIHTQLPVDIRNDSHTAEKAASATVKTVTAAQGRPAQMMKQTQIQRETL